MVRVGKLGVRFYVAAPIREVKMRNIIGTAALCAAMMAAGSAYAFECKRGEASFDKPGGFPERALTMIVPYGPAGGSGQVAAAMAEAVTELTAFQSTAITNQAVLGLLV